MDQLFGNAANINASPTNAPSCVMLRLLDIVEQHSAQTEFVGFESERYSTRATSDDSNIEKVIFVLNRLVA